MRGNFIVGFDRRIGTLAVVAAAILALVLTAIVSAAQITERSIALSTAVEGESGVTYDVKFTAPTAAGAMLIEFCTNTPLIGQACTAPAGMSVTGVATATSGVTVGATTANRLILTKAISVDEDVEVNLTGITNPTSAGTMYARILTYADAAAAAAYNSATPTVGSPRDSGSVAIAITQGIKVSGDVLESLSFCVSGGAIADNCGGTITAPVLALGEETAGVRALSAGALSTGNVHTQISTNAVNGAVVSLKSNAVDCGGLVRAGSEDNTDGCGIKPATPADVFNDAAGAGNALFGVKIAEATEGGDAVGTYTAVSGSGYSDALYVMNFTQNNSAGVTSVYGDQFLSTNNAPANNLNMQLTFGASISNNTPAGSYSADLSLIATGTF